VGLWWGVKIHGRCELYVGEALGFDDGFILPHTITLKYTCDSKPIPPRILSINTDSLLDDDLRFSSIRTMIAERRVSISLTITASRKA